MRSKLIDLDSHSVDFIKVLNQFNLRVNVVKSVTYLMMHS